METSPKPEQLKLAQLNNNPLDCQSLDYQSLDCQSLAEPAPQRCRAENLCSRCSEPLHERCRSHPDHRHLGLQAEPQAKPAKGSPCLFTNASSRTRSPPVRNQGGGGQGCGNIPDRPAGRRSDKLGVCSDGKDRADPRPPGGEDARNNPQVILRRCRVANPVAHLRGP